MFPLLRKQGKVRHAHLAVAVEIRHDYIRLRMNNPPNANNASDIGSGITLI